MRRRRQALELAVGGGLLLGPLVYALTLPAPQPASVCEPSEPEVILVETCEQERTVVEEEPEPVPVPVPVPVPEPEPAPEGAASFLFVSGKTLVLSTQADPSWGRGRLYEPPGEASFRVAKRADATKIPEHLWSARGRTFDLYGPDGKICSARIDKLHVVAQYDGWGLEGVVGDGFWDYESIEDVPKQLWREPLWQMDTHWLVGQIESDESCKGALWARDAALPAPEILRRTTEETEPAARRLASFEASRELAQLREDYQAWYAELPEDALEWEVDWATMAGTHRAEVHSWLDADGDVRLVALDFGADQESCGNGIDARISALEHVRGDRFVDTERFVDAAAIFDADLDGELEYLYVGHYDEGTFVHSPTLEAELYVDHDFECPC